MTPSQDPQDEMRKLAASERTKAVLDKICEAALPGERLAAIKYATELALICAEEQNTRAEALQAKLDRLGEQTRLTQGEWNEIHDCVSPVLYVRLRDALSPSKAGGPQGMTDERLHELASIELLKSYADETEAMGAGRVDVRVIDLRRVLNAADRSGPRKEA